MDQRWSIILILIIALGGSESGKNEQSWFECFFNESTKTEHYRTGHRVCRANTDIFIGNCKNFTNLRTIFVKIDIDQMNLKNLTVQVDNATILEEAVPDYIHRLNIRFARSLGIIKLRKFSKLKELNVSGNNISRLADVELHQQVSLRSFDVSFNNLTLFGGDSTPVTRTLTLRRNLISKLDEVIKLADELISMDLSGNLIENLTGVIFISGNLRILDLSANKINDISISTFVGLPSLRQLILADNELRHLDERTFINNNKLTKLSLRNNKLTELSDKIFRNLVQLQCLDLSKNNLVKISPGTFQYLDNLSDLILSENKHFCTVPESGQQIQFLLAAQRLQNVRMDKLNLTLFPMTLTRSVRLLDLSANDYTAIQWGDLDSYPLLQTLKLQSNKIEKVEIDVLGRLDYLENLYLDDNKLKRIPKSLPESLRVVRFSHNDIGEIQSNDFYDLANLLELRLNSNKLTAIKDGAFEPLVSLELLDISNNPLIFLNVHMFLGPSRLKVLSLSSLKSLAADQGDSFPIPDMSNIIRLNLTESSKLGDLLLRDAATLNTMKMIEEFDLSNANISSIPYIRDLMPRMKVLTLTGNTIDCTNITWLADWIKDMKQARTKSDLRNRTSDVFKVTILTKFKDNSHMLMRDRAVPDWTGEPKCFAPLSKVDRYISDHLEGNNMTNGTITSVVLYTVDDIIHCGYNDTRVRYEGIREPIRIQSEQTLLRNFENTWFVIFGNKPDHQFSQSIVHDGEMKGCINNHAGLSIVSTSNDNNVVSDELTPQNENSAFNSQKGDSTTTPALTDGQPYESTPVDPKNRISNKRALSATPTELFVTKQTIVNETGDFHSSTASSFTTDSTHSSLHSTPPDSSTSPSVFAYTTVIDYLKNNRLGKQQTGIYELYKNRNNSFDVVNDSSQSTNISLLAKTELEEYENLKMNYIRTTRELITPGTSDTDEITRAYPAEDENAIESITSADDYILINATEETQIIRSDISKSQMKIPPTGNSIDEIEIETFFETDSSPPYNLSEMSVVLFPEDELRRGLTKSPKEYHSISTPERVDKRMTLSKSKPDSQPYKSHLKNSEIVISNETKDSFFDLIISNGTEYSNGDEHAITESRFANEINGFSAQHPGVVVFGIILFSLFLLCAIMLAMHRVYNPRQMNGRDHSDQSLQHPDANGRNTDVQSTSTVTEIELW